MRKLIIFISSIWMILIVILCTPSEDITINRYENSDYIFSGELIKQSASTMPDYVKDQNASIVKVNKVLKASQGHENFEGREITVVINRNQQTELKPGYYGIFFTKTWLFGKSLAVLMNDVEQDTSKIDEVRKQIKQSQQEEDNKTLESRVKSADLIVYGSIDKIGNIEYKNRNFETEHDPVYKLAVINVKEALKNSNNLNSVKFYFASSDDIHWYRAPKFNVGDEGIFLLKRTSQVGDEKEPYILINSLDFQNRSRLEDIKKILK